VTLPTAEGLQKGDALLYQGVQVGEVRELAFGDEHGVAVRARLIRPLPLTTAARAALVPVDMFGRQSITLRAGSGGRRLQNGDTLTGDRPANLTTKMATLSRQAERMLGDSTVELVRGALGDLGSAAGSLDALARTTSALVEAQGQALGAVAGNAAALTHSLAVAADSGALVSTRTSMEAAAANLARATARLDSASASLASVLGKLDRGEGSAGRLVNDPLLYDRTTVALGSLAALLTDVRQNPKRYINVKVF
jgi:phospholipid/cholesterol/gamma-HCH transport system substrate-binding protein